jgi:O-antigen/teichoic acid export membrane protein
MSDRTTASQAGSGIAPVAMGAIVQTMYVERQMRAYAVYHDEVSSLSYLNTQATLFFTIASSLFSFAVSIWTNAIFYTGLTAAGEVATKYVSWGLLILGAVFICLGSHALYSRKRSWSAIIQGSRAR